MYTVEAYDLTKVFSSKRHKSAIVALDGLTLTVPQGEVYGLMGPSSAGKSTLFKALFGLVKADAGDLFINGLTPSNPRSRGNVGFLPENPSFPGHLTSRQLLELAGRLYEMTDKDIGDRADAMLEMTGLHRWPNLKIKKFSKGLIQKIGLAQAMISDPDVLILDEPFDGLDNKNKDELMKMVDKIRAEAKTILISTHFRSDIEPLADRIGIMQKGRIVQTVDIASLKEETCMYEIEANMGHSVVEIPEEVGRKIRVSTKSMIVELVDPEKINDVIDQIRLRGISIRSVRPLKTKLEQSLYRDLKPQEDTEVMV